MYGNGGHIDPHAQGAHVQGDDIIVKDEEVTLSLFKPPIQLGRKPVKFRPPLIKKYKT